MSGSDDSIENIDFGGRFARQFFNNNWPNIEGDAHLHCLNPTTSTPVASDNSICDSGYESFGQAHRKSSTSPTNSFQHGSIDINNNSVNCNSTATIKQQSAASTCSSTSAATVIAAAAAAAATANAAETSSTITATATPIDTSTRTPLKQQLTQQINTHVHSSDIIASNDEHEIINKSTPQPHQAPSPLKPQRRQFDAQPHHQHQNQSFQSTRHVNLYPKCCNPSTSNTNSSPMGPDELAKLTAGIGLMKLIMTPDVVVRQQRSNSLFTTTPAVATASLSTSNPWSSQDVYQRFNSVDKIERAASLHRTAASYSEPQYTWSGQLPSRSYKNPVYSCKVFLGGVPWDVTEQGLIETFGRFGPLRVQWPGKDVRQQSGPPKVGYVYLIYESERFVKALLQACTQDFGAGSHPEKYYYQISSRRMRFKEVQVIPWVLADSNYIRNQSGMPDMGRTVFVGALHGMLTAEGLAKIMNDLFNGVAYVGIDSDKHKYPIGSGRVTFNNHKSYMKAVSAAFVEVKSSQFCKKIQVDPYLHPSECSTCHIQSGPIYCRDCLRYFCKTCWNWHHSTETLIGRQHRPMMRKKRET